MGCYYCDSYSVGMFSISMMVSHNSYWQMFAEICDQLVMYSGCTCIVTSHRHPEIDSSMAFIDFWRILWVPDSLSSGVWSNFTCIWFDPRRVHDNFIGSFVDLYAFPCARASKSNQPISICSTSYHKILMIKSYDSVMKWWDHSKIWF